MSFGSWGPRGNWAFGPTGTVARLEQLLADNQRASR
jgi:hypothetical protein